MLLLLHANLGKERDIFLAVTTLNKIFFPDPKRHIVQNTCCINRSSPLPEIGGLFHESMYCGYCVPIVQKELVMCIKCS